MQASNSNSRIVDEGSGYLLELTSGEQVLDAKLVIAFCDNAQCHCNDANLYIQTKDGSAWAEPSSVVRAQVELDTGELVGLPADCTQTFRQSLQEQVLGGSLLRLLRERWRRTKLMQDPDSDAWRKEDWSWWKPGLLVCWQDAYPGAFDEIVSIAGQRYLVDDQYCCAPKCACDDVTLTFVPIADGVNTERTDNAAHSHICVHLSAWSATNQDGQPLDPGLLPLWRAYSGIAGIKKQMQQRRLELQAIGRELYRQAKTVAPPARTEKVGRNAACPCASGKKYKKCCGKN